MAARPSWETGNQDKEKTWRQKLLLKATKYALDGDDQHPLYGVAELLISKRSRKNDLDKQFESNQSVRQQEAFMASLYPQKQHLELTGLSIALFHLSNTISSHIVSKSLRSDQCTLNFAAQASLSMLIYNILNGIVA